MTHASTLSSSLAALSRIPDSPAVNRFGLFIDCSGVLSGRRSSPFLTRTESDKLIPLSIDVNVPPQHCPVPTVTHAAKIAERLLKAKATGFPKSARRLLLTHAGCICRLWSLPDGTILPRQRYTGRPHTDTLIEQARCRAEVTGKWIYIFHGQLSGRPPRASQYWVVTPSDWGNQDTAEPYLDQADGPTTPAEAVQ